jgi:peptidoglycan hydrolase CwlO-like protein
VLQLVAAIGAVALLAGSSSADLSSRYQAHKHRADQLRSAIAADSGKIRGFQGRIGDLEQRLSALQTSITVQERQLAGVRSQLDAARVRLSHLQAEYDRGRKVLAAQLVAQYESPPPTLMNVVVDAQGFNDLLNRLNNMRAVERHNAQTVALVNNTRKAVTVQTKRLAQIQGRMQRAVTSVLVERDNVAQLKLTIVGEELVYVRARGRKFAQLTSLRQTLTREAKILDARAAAAARAALPTGGAVVAPGSCANAPFVAHGGAYGFFPAAGTNYSVGEEPIIAARLDQLGRALQLHLIGISGYRSPAHSVEVGGFANDPHTQGLASDTPGVEGVPEATLEKFCLTRPFPGAHEADHIQLS